MRDCVCRVLSRVARTHSMSAAANTDGRAASCSGDSGGARSKNRRKPPRDADLSVAIAADQSRLERKLRTLEVGKGAGWARRSGCRAAKSEYVEWRDRDRTLSTTEIGHTIVRLVLTGRTVKPKSRLRPSHTASSVTNTTDKQIPADKTWSTPVTCGFGPNPIMAACGSVASLTRALMAAHVGNFKGTGTYRAERATLFTPLLATGWGLPGLESKARSRTMQCPTRREPMGQN